MNIVLTCPPASALMRLSPNVKRLSFPMETLCWASFLEQCGHHAGIYHDLPYTQDGFWQYVHVWRADVLIILTDSSNLQACLKLARIVKETHADMPVVLGGDIAGFLHDRILKEVLWVDYVLRGEGEAVLADFFRELRPRGLARNISHIRGVTYRQEGRVCINPVQDAGVLLEDLPPLLYHLVDMTKVGRETVAGALPLLTGRGCCFHCRFCIDARVGGASYRCKSPAKMLAEICDIQAMGNTLDFFFAESTFTANRKRVVTFLQMLIDRALSISWICTTRVDCVDSGLLQMMKKAGCCKIIYGVESFSDRMLGLMGKGHSVADAVMALDMTVQEGILAEYNLIFGFPGETEKTLQESILGVRRLYPRISCRGVSRFYPWPRTRVYGMMQRQGMIDDQVFFLEDKADFFLHKYYSKHLLNVLLACEVEAHKMVATNDPLYCFT